MASKAAQNYVKGLMYQGSRDGSITMFIDPKTQLKMMMQFDQKNSPDGGAPQPGKGPTSLSEMLAMQRAENATTKTQNIATRQGTLNELGGIPTAFQADPLWQATRQSARAQLANPEALNDQTQQLIQNRAANQTNAAANTQRGQLRQQLAGMGMLGSSAEQGAMGQLERDRMASLADSATKFEIERAGRRTQDIQAAQQMGAALAGQESGVRQWATGKRADTDLYFQPENLSGYAGYFAGLSGVGGGASSQFGTQQNSTPGFQLTGFNQYGPQSPGQTGFAPGLRGDYAWTGQGGGYGGYPQQEQDYSNYLSDYWNSMSQPRMSAPGWKTVATPYGPETTATGYFGQGNLKSNDTLDFSSFGG